MSASMPTGSSHLTYTMGAIVAAGGTAAYITKKSTRSFLGGLAFGGLMAWAGYMINNGEEERGFRLATTNSLALTAGMGYRFYKHPRVFPAGVVTALGLASTAYHYHKYDEWMQ